MAGARLSGADLAIGWAGCKVIGGIGLVTGLAGGAFGTRASNEGWGQRANFEGGLGGWVLDGQACLLLLYHVGLPLRLGNGLWCEGGRGELCLGSGGGFGMPEAVKRSPRVRGRRLLGRGGAVSTSTWAFSWVVGMLVAASIAKSGASSWGGLTSALVGAGIRLAVRARVPHQRRGPQMAYHIRHCCCRW